MPQWRDDMNRIVLKPSPAALFITSALVAGLLVFVWLHWRGQRQVELVVFSVLSVLAASLYTLRSELSLSVTSREISGERTCTGFNYCAEPATGIKEWTGRKCSSGIPTNLGSCKQGPPTLIRFNFFTGSQFHHLNYLLFYSWPDKSYLWMYDHLIKLTQFISHRLCRWEFKRFYRYREGILNGCKSDRCRRLMIWTIKKG